MVLDAPFPPDIRLKKEIPVLVGDGFEVDLLCYRRAGEKHLEEWNGCKIIRSQKSVGKLRKTLIDIYNSMFFSNPLIKRELKKISNQYQIVHVHDLPVSRTVLSFAKQRGLTTVLDMHENYPEALKIWFSWRKGFVIRLKNSLFFTYNKWFKREREMVNAFDRVIAVVDEMKERLVDIHGVPAEKIVVVSNTEPKDLYRNISSQSSTVASKNIVYVGGIGPHRGLDTAVEAMPHILKQVPDARLVIVGSGNPDNINHLKNLAAKNHVSDAVKFTGQLPFEEAISYMQQAFLNIIPHHSNAHTDNTIPHKLFQMLNSNYPVMVSSCKPLKRIVEEYNAGVVYKAGDASDFASKVVWSVNHPQELFQMSQQGHKAVQEGRYNWETDAEVLRTFYNTL